MQFQAWFRVPVFILYLSDVLYHVLGYVGVNRRSHTVLQREAIRHPSDVLYYVLDCIGVNTWMVKRRREIFLYREAMEEVGHKLDGVDRNFYHFGSQSEGATTLGLLPDTDMLYTINGFNIMYSLADWLPGEINFLILPAAVLQGRRPFAYARH